MALGQITINGAQYYFDNGNYYKFHIVSNPKDGLYLFAAKDLGIGKTSGFTTEESARINDLKIKYLLLKNGQALPMPYLLPDAPAINKDDVILRKVEAKDVPGLVRHSCGSYSLPGSNCSVCQKPFP